MRFLNWLKGLFTKENPTPKAPVEKLSIYMWRNEWKLEVKRLALENIKTFDLASDIHNIRPDWSSLNLEQKSEIIAEFFRALAFYESGYNSKSESVDVGTVGDKQTWSVGLLQLSGVDKKNLGLAVGFDYEGLKDPIKNIQQGVAIMINQIKKRGKMIIPKSEKGNPGVYWATLNPGNQYDKSAEIISSAQAVKFENKEQKEPETLPTNSASNYTPWMNIAEKELGVTESNNPKRVIEYHQATSLKAKDTATAWCSAYVCWVLEKAGYRTTKSAWARNWLTYGQIADMQRGAIVVFERNAPGGDSHVGFCTGKQTATHIEVLSGNSSNSVCIKMYPKSDLLGLRWPVKA